MAANKFCTRNIFILGLLGFLAVLASFLFTSLLRDVLVESLKDQHPAVAEECISTIITTGVTLSCMSLVTFPVLMVGIHKLKTWMVLPWSLVTGFQTLAGGVVLWYLVFQTSNATLIECLSLYALVAYSFIVVKQGYFIPSLPPFLSPVFLIPELAELPGIPHRNWRSVDCELFAMRELKCLTVYLTVVLWIVFYISLYLFGNFFYKVIQESFGNEELPIPSDGLRRPVIMAFYCLTFLSIGTYVVFMMGIYKLNTRLMLPWALVIGFKCIFGGVLLIYASSYVTAGTLLEGMFYYSTAVISFVGIYYVYLKIIAVKKIVEDRTAIVDNVSVISLTTDEKPKTIV
ncbi:unnamed protein product [Nezara viridula]|uniref:Uncharacterized protein n=1 Tax=Nezara viridula TaxID=85310 RepID=A0A9P0H999_NEZVI|nr:unnamed protein product [Nezara viridula]